MVDMTDAIELCAVTRTVRRAAADDTTNAEGYVVPGVESTFTIRCVINPAPGERIARLPEGQNSGNRMRQIITGTRLEVARAGRRGDIVVEDGVDLEVFEIDRWDAHGEFFDALAQQVSR